MADALGKHGACTAQEPVLGTEGARGTRSKLCGVVARKLEQMETDMERGELASEDLERDAKAVASMIGGMEKVAATVPDADNKRTSKSEDADGEDNVERLQREIIARFEQIQRRRNAERGSE